VFEGEGAASLPELGTLVVLVGGGGRIAGMATAVRAIRPEMRLVCGEEAVVSSPGI
jgi:threonine dehydratase